MEVGAVGTGRAGATGVGLGLVTVDGGFWAGVGEACTGVGVAGAAAPVEVGAGEGVAAV